MAIQSYAAESVQNLLSMENIEFSRPDDLINQLAELWNAGSLIMIMHEKELYVLTQTIENNSSNTNYPDLLLTIQDHLKITFNKRPHPLSLEDAFYQFFATHYDYFYISNCNALISFKQNTQVAHRFAQKKISQLESQCALEKATLIKKNQIIRALVYELREYKVAMYIPGMRWIGKLGKLIEPGLGNLYQYHPRDLKAPLYPSKNLTHFPKISIVTPSYQQGHYLEKTLQSVLEQNYPNLEYFIKDGGSKDNSQDILKNYAHKLAGWVSEPDGGQSQAINIGFAQTTGDIMAWLNSDDLLLPGTLAFVADYFNNHPEIDVIYGNRLLIDEYDKEIGHWILPNHNDTVLSWADFIPQETLFWRRRIWEKVGEKIDESFRFAMDWDLLIRFRDAGAKFAHVPHFMGAFRIHETQKTSADNDIGAKETRLIQQRVLGYVPTKSKIRRTVLPFILHHIAVNFAYIVIRKWKRKKYQYVFPTDLME